MEWLKELAQKERERRKRVAEFEAAAKPLFLVMAQLEHGFYG
jgi:hypothetical protein